MRKARHQKMLKAMRDVVQAVDLNLVLLHLQSWGKRFSDQQLAESFMVRAHKQTHSVGTSKCTLLRRHCCAAGTSNKLSLHP